MIRRWVALLLILGTVVDAMVHHAYFATIFLVLTLHHCAVVVLRSHKLWGNR